MAQEQLTRPCRRTSSSRRPVRVEVPVTDGPSAGWAPLELGELWQYRELLYFPVRRNIKLRYKQPVLGAAGTCRMRCLSHAAVTAATGLCRSPSAAAAVAAGIAPSSSAGITAVWQSCRNATTFLPTLFLRRRRIRTPDTGCFERRAPP